MNFKEKPILGMIHLSGDTIQNVKKRALEEIDILIGEGVDGIIVENYHGDVVCVDYVLANMKDRPKYLGINILPNNYETAFMLAKEYKADFIQLDHISGKYKNTTPIDEKVYSDLYVHNNEKIKVFGGVWPKYYEPIKGSDLEVDISYATLICDAVVVTGDGTGKETPINKIQAV